MQFKTFYWLSHYGVYTIISKYGKHTCQLKFKKEPKNFPQETMTAGENRFDMR